MPPESDLSTAEDFELETLVDFDRKLAIGSDPSTDDGISASVRAVHECQRLLEEIWPQNLSLPISLTGQLGRFTILRELGRGGFGIVFLAVDSRLRRQVALKVPHPEVLVTRDLRQRFLREAEAASRLSHPNIVTVYEMGEEGPVLFIASAYCDGPTLADRLRQQMVPVPASEAAGLVAILSAAVAHAHQRGILHRDLKPGNILLQRCDAAPSGREGAGNWLGYMPRICDFGLAKLLDRVSQETCSGTPIGSASYMAPEQAAGRIREQGPATDIYALGVLLYELLTGRPPFRGETDLETFHLVSNEDPPPPRALRPGLPRDLETICLTCLEKQPDRRYTSAAGLKEDLQRFLEGKPVHVRPAAVWRQAAKWARRRPVHATLAMVVVLAVGSAVSLLLGYDALLRRHNQDLSEAVTNAERRMQESERRAHLARVMAAVAEDRVEFERRHGLAYQLKLIHQEFNSGNLMMADIMRGGLRPPPGQPPPRGFGWDHLHELFRPEVTLLGEADPPKPEGILQLAISPDSRTVAGGRADGVVVLWDLVEKRLLHTLNHQESGPGRQIYFLAFSPDGRLLASASDNSDVKLWDVAAGRERAAFPADRQGSSAPLSHVFALRFTDSSDCLNIFREGLTQGSCHVLSWSVPGPGEQPELIAALGPDQLPRFGRPWSFDTPNSTRAARATPSWSSYVREHLAILDDRGLLVIKDGASEITLHEPVAFLPVVQMRAPLFIPAIYDFGLHNWSQDERARFLRQARRIAGTTESDERRFLGPCDIPRLSPDGRTMAFHLGNVGVALVDVASGRIRSAYAPEQKWRVVDLAFSPDGQFLVMAGFHPQIHVWRLRPPALAGHQKEVWGLTFSPDGKSLASAADDSTIQLWDVTDGRRRAILEGHGSLVTAVAYSPDGKLLASAGFDRTVRLWDATTREPVAILRGHRGRVRSLAFSPDGGTLATAGDDRTIRLWDVAARSERAPPLVGHTGNVFSLAFSPEGETLYSGSLDETIRVWDWAAGGLHAVWKVDDQVYSMAIAPDGQTLAVGFHNGKLVLWDVAAEKARPPVPGHVGDILGLTFSPDGLTLASAGRDQTVRLWEPVTGQELMVLKGHLAPVHAVTFSPDGMILVTGSHDGAIKFWRGSRARSHRSDRPESGRGS